MLLNSNMQSAIKAAIPVGLIVLSFGLPLLIPNHHSIIIFILGTLWILSKPDLKELLSDKVRLGCFLSISLISLVGVIYSSNKGQAIATVETLSSLVILPIIVLSSRPILTSNVARRILIAFVVGVIALNLTSLFFISYDVWDAQKLQSKLIEANYLIVRIHPVFTSLYISFCIFFLLDQFFPLQTDNRNKLGLVIFGLAVLVVYLIWLNSRAGILAFLIASIFFIHYKFKSIQKIFAYGSIIMLLGLISLNPFMRYRFFKAPLNALDAHVKHNTKDPNVYTLLNRTEICQCNVESLKFNSIFFGYGTGDVRDVLKECYRKNGFEKPMAESMDSHNEYFAQLLRNGLLGLAAFVALLLLPFLHALKNKDTLLGAFIILFSVTALFENVLGSQKGVAFLALILPLLYLLSGQKNK